MLERQQGTLESRSLNSEYDLCKKKVYSELHLINSQDLHKKIKNNQKLLDF